MTLDVVASCELSRCTTRRRPGRTEALASAVILAAVGLLNSAGGPRAHSAQADDGWIGKRVVQKYTGFRLKNKDQKIDPKGIAIFRVENANGAELWLKEKGRGLSGWAPADQVVPVDEAIAFFTDYIRANPRDPHGYMMRATIWHEERHELDIALGDYNEVIRLDPTQAYAYFNRGNLWSVKQDFDKAIADYNAATRLDAKDASFYNNRGIAWNSKNDFDRAIADFSEAIRLDPKHAPAYNNRGNVWTSKTDFDKAIADFSEAIRLDSKYALAFNNRGTVWSSKTDYERAIVDYNESIRLDPKDARPVYNRGSAWRAKKNYDKAIADYNEAIRVDPKFAHAHYGRAVVLFLTGRDGLESSVKAVLDKEGWHKGLSQYAVLLGHFSARRAGRNDEAKKLLNEAAGKCDTAAWPYPVVKYLRGEIDESKLLEASTDSDKMTEARCYLGLDMEQKGRKEEALAHFRWVKDHGNTTFSEYTMALTELDRLTR